MTTNPYFAYSIKSEYVSESDSSPGENQHQHYRPFPPLTPPNSDTGRSKKPPLKKYINRACDVCSIRKTKCDHSRPCRLCVANNVKCTELRVRKKSGPKSLSKKTIDSINSVTTEFSGIAADSGLVSQLDSGAVYPDLDPLVRLLSGLPVDFLQELVPFTLSSVIEQIPMLIGGLKSRPRAMGCSIYTNATRYAVTTLCLVILETLLMSNPSVEYRLLLRDLQIYILLTRSACDRLVMFNDDPERIDFEVQYNLALAELHQFSYHVLRKLPSAQKFVHLRAAMSHCELLEASDSKAIERKAELHNTLQIWQRHMFLFSPERAFRAPSFFAQPLESKDDVDAKFGNSFLCTYFDLLRVTNFLPDFARSLPEPFNWQHTYDLAGSSDFTYATLKLSLSLICESTLLLVFLSEYVAIHIISLALQFKILLSQSHKLRGEFIADEIMELIGRMNSISRGCSSGSSVKLIVERFSLSSVFLEMLSAYLQVNHEMDFASETLGALMEFTSTLSISMDSSNKLWSVGSEIGDWVARFSTP